MGRHTKAFDDQPGRDDDPQGTRTSNQPPARPPRQARPHPRDTRVPWDQSRDRTPPPSRDGSYGQTPPQPRDQPSGRNAPQPRDQPSGRNAPQPRDQSYGRSTAHQPYGQGTPQQSYQQSAPSSRGQPPHRRGRAGGDPSNAETRTDLKPIRDGRGKGPALDRSGDKPEDERPVRMPWIGKVPLLPTVAGIIAVGMVATAYGTSTISLNFTGGGAPAQSQANPQCGDVGCPASSQNGDTTGGTMPANPISVSFSNVPRPDGFKGTVTISNHGSTSVKGWTLSFTIPSAKVYSVTGATVLKEGSAVSLRTSATLAPGATTHVIFFARGTADTPTTCTFNKAACGTGESNG